MNGDFVIIDFEGEPAACLSERARKKTPLVDVAAMLLFSYAVYVSLFMFTRNQPEDLVLLRPWAECATHGLSPSS